MHLYSLRMCALFLGILVLIPNQGFPQVTHVEELRFPPLPPLEIPEPTRVELTNGMVVLLIEDHELPIISVSATIRTGARLEPKGKIGLAGLTGTVMRSGGSRTMSGDALDDYLEGKAASIETGIGQTSGSASMNSLKDDFPEVFKVFSSVLRDPAFDPEKITIAKNQIMASIARQNDNPDSIASREFDKLVYGSNSPYAWHPTYATINAITREDLIAWHQRYFLPNRIILGLAGDFQTEQAIKLVNEVFGDWPAGPPIEEHIIPYDTNTKPGVFFVEKSDMTQAKIIMGHLGLVRSDPDYYAVVVVNQILSGSFGARLFSTIRSNKGLAYDVYGGIGFGWDYPGLATLTMSTKTETTGPGIDALIEEAKKLVTDPPTQEEVDKAKASILNSFVFSIDSPTKILGKYMTYEYYNYPTDWLIRFKKGIEEVSIAQVRAAAGKHLRPERFAMLVIGPRDGIKPALARYDQVKELDITIPES